MNRRRRAHGSVLIEVIVAAIAVSIVLTAAFATLSDTGQRHIASARRDQLAAATGAIDATVAYVAHATAGPGAPGALGGAACDTQFAAAAPWPAVTVTCTPADASDIAPDARRVHLAAAAGPVTVNATYSIDAAGVAHEEAFEVHL